jgi:hypothetical protein
MNYYTYIYTDPLNNDEPFYVGKGRRDRAFKHLTYSGDSPFYKRIKEIQASGVNPNITIFECSSEVIAFELERGLINLIGMKIKNRGSLLNLVVGIQDPVKATTKIDPEFLSKWWERFSNG